MPPTPFLQIFLPLSAALGLSLIVERVLEFAKNIFETIPLRSNTVQLPKREKTEDTATRIKAAKEYEDNISKLHDGKHYKRWTVLFKEASDPDDGIAFKKCILMLLGFAIGIICAEFSKLRLMGAIIPSFPSVYEWLDYVLTGLLIGGGSTPIHAIITFVVERKAIMDTVQTAAGNASEQEVSERQVAESAIPKPPAEGIPSPILRTRESDEWIDIPYDGGVDREILENCNFRPHDPDCVVYHHTAMHSSSTFQDVVNVIKAHTYDTGRIVNGKPEKAHWLTGYNCVILADGSICPFCRWDRAGIHAGDMNGRSLGIAFNGNFETNPKAAGANINNRYGINRPTDAQLKSGARVIALWILLYGINHEEFSKKIMAHRNSPGAQTVCPGSNFPSEDLEKLVFRYCNAWSGSAIIENYKTRPYLYKPKKEVKNG